MTHFFSYKSSGQALAAGAALGFAAALVYGMGFVLYGIAHTTIRILASPANGLVQTLLANAISVLIGSMFFAVLFGIFAAAFQAVTLALIFAFTKRMNTTGSARTGAKIGLALAAGLFLGLIILFRNGPQIMTQVFWNQSFLFWFGLPGAIYILMNTWLGSRLALQSN